MEKLILKKMGSYFQSGHHDLQAVFSKIKMLNTIQQQLIPYLDPYLANHCQAANLYNNKLVIITANASIATQLRYQLNDLLQRFKENPLLKPIQHIELKVRPASNTPILRKDKIKKMSLLSPATASIVRETASSLKDPRLKEIMERIAGRIQKIE